MMQGYDAQGKPAHRMTKGLQSRSLAAVATDATAPRKWSIRSRFSSSEVVPALVGGAPYGRLFSPAAILARTRRR